MAFDPDTASLVGDEGDSSYSKELGQLPSPPRFHSSLELPSEYFTKEGMKQGMKADKKGSFFDPSSATKFDPNTAVKPAPVESKDEDISKHSLLRKALVDVNPLVGAVDIVATGVAQTAGMVAGGLHGAEQLATGKGIEEASKAVKGTSEKVSQSLYTPKSYIGKKAVEGIGEALEKASSTLGDKAEEEAIKSGASPKTAAQLKSLVEFTTNAGIAAAPFIRSVGGRVGARMYTPKPEFNPELAKQDYVPSTDNPLNIIAEKKGIPVPKTKGEVRDSFRQINSLRQMDRVLSKKYWEESNKLGVTDELRHKFQLSEEGMYDLTPEEKAIYDSRLKPLNGIFKNLTEQARKMGTPLPEQETIPRVAINQGSLFQRLSQGDFGGLRHNQVTPRGLANVSSSEKSRTMYVLKDSEGNRQVISLDGKEVTGWKNKESFELPKSEKVLKVGDEYTDDFGKKWTVDHGKIPEIEQNSHVQYLHDQEAVMLHKITELQQRIREQEWINSWRESPTFKDMAMDPEEYSIAKPTSQKWDFLINPKIKPAFLGKAKEPWKQLVNKEAFPQFRDLYFEPRIAETIDDFSRVYGDTAMSAVQNFLIKNMMLNPLPHINNEFMHYYNTRGVTGIGAIPTLSKGMGEYLKGKQMELGPLTDPSFNESFRNVISQDGLYLDILKNGGSILSADVRMQGWWTSLVEKGLKEFAQAPENRSFIKENFGKVSDAYNSLSQKSSELMWVTRDAMYTDLVRRAMKKGMNIKEAIADVERHMPSYQIPERVLGSRTLSQVMQNPKVTVFSRYHYGMVKSLVNTMKDFLDPSLSFKERTTAINQMAAIGVGMAVLYPLLDKFTQYATGNENAETRRAGGYHLIDTIMKMSEGEKDSRDLAMSLLTPAPYWQVPAQLLTNREFWSGKPISQFNPMEKDFYKDYSGYLAKQVPQVGSVIQTAGESGGGFPQFMAKQMDVRLPTESQVAKTEKFKQRVKRAKERERRKRGEE